MPLKTIDNLCRICVQESHTYKHIYDQYILDIRLFEIINDLCQLNIYLGDGLPEYICACCHGKLLGFQKFKQTSHEGKAALLSIKMKLEKMNSEAREAAAQASISFAHAQIPLEDNWSSGQLPVESIGQLLEVHIKEEPEDVNLGESEEYSTVNRRRGGGSHQLDQVHIKEEPENVNPEEPEDYSTVDRRRETNSNHLEQVHRELSGERVVVKSLVVENTLISDGEKSAVIGSKTGQLPSSNSTMKSRKKCRKCFVPHCKNTTSGNAEKGFVNVPLHRDRRIAWFKAARREISTMPSYELYCCGDHFNLQEDTENYMYHKTMGVSLRIKKDVLPHIFQCQPERADGDVVPLDIPGSRVAIHSIFGEGMSSSSAYGT